MRRFATTIFNTALQHCFIVSFVVKKLTSTLTFSNLNFSYRSEYCCLYEIRCLVSREWLMDPKTTFFTGLIRLRFLNLFQNNWFFLQKKKNRKYSFIPSWPLSNRIALVTQTTLRRAAGSSNFQTTNQIALDHWRKIQFVYSTSRSFMRLFIASCFEFINFL